MADYKLADKYDDGAEGMIRDARLECGQASSRAGAEMGRGGRGRGRRVELSSPQSGKFAKMDKVIARRRKMIALLQDATAASIDAHGWTE